jgi:hypothetical protein
MKKILSILAVVFIVILGTVGCKKSNTALPINTISHWELDGKSDTGTTTLYSDQQNYISSNQYISDTITNVLAVQFSAKPTTNAKFAVVGAGITPNSKECAILGITVTPSTASIINIQSIGNAGDSVTVAIVDGKITATFSNIEIQDKGIFYSLISGVLIQQ